MIMVDYDEVPSEDVNGGEAPGKRMKTAERDILLQEIFAKSEFVDAESLARLLSASDSTVRRDLMRLEAQGIVKRVHGGAISIKTRDDSLDFQQLAISCPEAKASIGRAAAALLHDQQTVILGTGTTVVEVARNLTSRQLHVITNSIPVSQVFWDCKNIEVTLTGGYVYPRAGVQLGPFCEQMLSSIHADVAVLGIGGISAVGLTDSNTLIMGTLKKMIDRSRKVVVVADHTKFGRDGMVKIANLDEIDVIVSDQDLPPQYRELLESRSVELVLA